MRTVRSVVETLSCVFAALVCWFPLNVRADEHSSDDAMKFFENEVRPLLIKRCYECHSEKEASGALTLDSLPSMLGGGDSGPAIVPGDPNNSLLIAAIRYESLEMPPDEKLPNEEIEVLTRWVAIGAPWPGADSKLPVRTRELFDDDDRQWWAIAPVELPNIPELEPPYSNWSRNEIDYFIADRLAQEGLTPAPEASRIAMVRRVFLDVTGLPPSPKQVAEFVEDDAPNAYERLVDRLLASKGYGEHAARQWLDLVRYADSDGYRADGYRPDAWRYRDYVIRSFNEDKPYDRFVQEQIAADELFPDDVHAQVGLGYLRHWVYEWNIRDARTQWKTIIEDVTDTTADTFLGLGLQCAKCHNHKFDPLLQKDYFRLQAFFAPLLPAESVIADAEQVSAYQSQRDLWQAKTADLQAQIDSIEQPYRDKYRNIAIDRFPDDLKIMARKPPDARAPDEAQLVYLIERQVQSEYDRLDQIIAPEDKERLVALRRALKEFDALKPEPLPIAMTVSDVGPIAPPTRLPKRKDELVEPGIPSILNADPMPITSQPVPSPASPTTTGRRSQLAKWLTDPSNPLSTRVIVNRIWQSHFGRGLAENPSDFGRLGGPPSHPELLDWLTVQFIHEQWSLKALHRRILLSATYRQSATHPRFNEYAQQDSANVFHWRHTTTRLRAEQIRDALLFVSGTLEDCEGGPGQLADASCRTIYTRVMRNSPDSLLNGFDLPQFFSSIATRNTTTTPVQSLLMINSDTMLAYGRLLASQVQSESSERTAQVQLAWKRVYGREPTQVEIRQSLDFIESQQTEVALSDDGQPSGLLDTAKLPYRDGQGLKFELDEAKPQVSVPHHPTMDVREFTIETFFQLRSIASNGAVRTLVSKWNGSNQAAGWRFGVTGAGSRRKPQTLVLQMAGKKSDGAISEAAIFSDHHIQINTPYYASATFRLPTDSEPGTVTFYVKDLSNDDEPLLTAVVSHDIVADLANNHPLAIGSWSAKDRQGFDGVIDDVRWVGTPLGVDAILQTVENENSATVGYWRFETVPGVLRNSTADRLNLRVRGDTIVRLTPDEAAFADFCHALLNSNEFLYSH